MKILLKRLVFIVLLSGFLCIPSCKSAFVWDPSGNWNMTITYTTYAFTYSEIFSFIGSENAGAVTGFTISGSPSISLTGTYTKTADFSISIDFDAIITSYHMVFNFTGTSSESAPNTITGSGQWFFDGPLYSTITWTATKITNLQ
jgi:hypothetical protein